MKCINCGTDNAWRDRIANSRRCKNCQHIFVFEPQLTSIYSLTDVFFANTITQISSNQSLFFTPKQLFYALHKRLARSYRVGEIFLEFFLIAVGAVSGIYAIMSIYLINNPQFEFHRILAVILMLAGLTLILRRGFLLLFDFLPKAPKETKYYVTPSQSQSWIDRWQQVNASSLTKLLSTPKNQIIPIPISSDLSAYSFDRVVICDRDEIAWLLIANNFHFEKNCAVLSIAGYPANIFPIVMVMLRRNPELKVYALHDASPEGLSLVRRLRTSPDWFLNSNATIYDLGLLPRQLLKSRNILVQRSDDSASVARQLPEEIRQSLSKKELKWLDAGNFVELECFSPKKLIQVVTQGIANSQAADRIDDRSDEIGPNYEYAIEFDNFG